MFIYITANRSLFDFFKLKYQFQYQASKILHHSGSTQPSSQSSQSVIIVPNAELLMSEETE